MSLHPIKALDHVIDEYADYLRTEFRAKDPKLRAAIQPVCQKDSGEFRLTGAPKAKPRERKKR